MNVIAQSLLTSSQCKKSFTTEIQDSIFFLEIDFYALNSGAVRASKMSVIIYQSTQSNVPEELMF